MLRVRGDLRRELCLRLFRCQRRHFYNSVPRHELLVLLGGERRVPALVQDLQRGQVELRDVPTSPSTCCTTMTFSNSQARSLVSERDTMSTFSIK